MEGVPDALSRFEKAAEIRDEITALGKLKSNYNYLEGVPDALSRFRAPRRLRHLVVVRELRRGLRAFKSRTDTIELVRGPEDVVEYLAQE